MLNEDFVMIQRHCLVAVEAERQGQEGKRRTLWVISEVWLPSGGLSRVP